MKWTGSDAVDASLLACATPFHLLEPSDPIMGATVARIEERLVRGGVYRYEADTYYGGGQWVLLAGLLGWHYAQTGRAEAAWAQLRWMAQQACRDELPEQVAERLLAPEREQEWIERWGPSARPLLWSHAMYLTLAVDQNRTRDRELSKLTYHRAGAELERMFPVGSGRLSATLALVATPPMWNVRIVNWVPGSPIDWAAMIPTAIPSSTRLPVARSMP